ncbi:hypothetical protein OOZ15_19945, partial [Galbibacter sp. EGI 63066]|uniref:immunoglobulin domain-containing protein n=1 Tax=Galbibacter sp. EGI 63066 TaxID=2993559 RepID=UPI0022488C05
LPDPGNRLAPGTALAHDTWYYGAYVELDSGGNELCESARRLEVYVEFDELPLAPTLPDGGDQQAFCGGPAPTVNHLEATPAAGTELVWFDEATGGVRLAGITPLTDGATYYAESFDPDINCVNVDRSAVTVSLNGPVSVVDPIDNAVACAGGDATFAVTGSSGQGGDLSYLWEESTDDGASWTVIAGEESNIYTRTGVGPAEDGLDIRVTLGVAGCTGTVSSFAQLVVEGPVSITAQPQDA